MADSFDPLNPLNLPAKEGSPEVVPGGKAETKVKAEQDEIAPPKAFVGKPKTKPNAFFGVDYSAIEIKLAAEYAELLNAKKVVGKKSKDALKAKNSKGVSSEDLYIQKIEQLEAKNAELSAKLLTSTGQATADLVGGYQKEIVHLQQELAQFKNTQKQLATLETLHADLQAENSVLTTQLNKAMNAPEEPATSGAAFKAMETLLLEYRVLRVKHLELAIEEALADDDKQTAWPLLPLVSSNLCPECPSPKGLSSAPQPLLVPVEHPKFGQGAQCKVCNKTWKDPNPPKAVAKKAAFERLQAMQCLVGELGYDVEMAQYMIDSAGARRVLALAQKVPSIPNEHAEALTKWLAAEKNSSLAAEDVQKEQQKKVESSAALSVVAALVPQAEKKDWTFKTIPLNSPPQQSDPLSPKVLKLAELIKDNPTLAQIAKAELVKADGSIPPPPFKDIAKLPGEDTATGKLKGLEVDEIASGGIGDAAKLLQKAALKAATKPVDLGVNPWAQVAAKYDGMHELAKTLKTAIITNAQSGPKVPFKADPDLSPDWPEYSPDYNPLDLIPVKPSKTK